MSQGPDLEIESIGSNQQKVIHFDVDAGIEDQLMTPVESSEKRKVTEKKPKKGALHKSSFTPDHNHFAETALTPIKENSTPNPYEKENLPLRPYLKKLKNVEDNVHTLRLHEINYLMVNEDKP